MRIARGCLSVEEGVSGLVCEKPYVQDVSSNWCNMYNRSVHPVRTQMIQLELTTIKMTGESHDKTYVSLAVMQAWL